MTSWDSQGADQTLPREEKTLETLSTGDGRTWLMNLQIEMILIVTYNIFRINTNLFKSFHL